MKINQPKKRKMAFLKWALYVVHYSWESIFEWHSFGNKPTSCSPFTLWPSKAQKNPFAFPSHSLTHTPLKSRQSIISQRITNSAQGFNTKSWAWYRTRVFKFSHAQDPQIWWTFSEKPLFLKHTCIFCIKNRAPLVCLLALVN